jgi:hypothetical protein
MPLLLSHADRSQSELLDIVSPHYQQFAERNSWQMLLSREEFSFTDRNPHWSKIALLRKLLPEHDYVIWVDCDFIIRSEDNPLDAVKAQDFQSLVMEQTSHGPGPNTGFWILRNCEEAIMFLDELWKCGPLSDATLNDQASLAHLLGWSYLPFQTKPIAPSHWLAHTGWLDYRWNILLALHSEALLIAKAIHFGGMDNKVKAAMITRQLITDRLPGWERYVSDERRRQIKLAAERFPHPDER